MQEIISKRGRVSILHTIDTMEPGEVWNLDPKDWNVATIRTCCSAHKLDKEKIYRVFTASDRFPFITIQRIK